jgi:UDP-N-acetyl-D-mannosaminuronic acid transferase (WecB/TagA/CpsF family)
MDSAAVTSSIFTIAGIVIGVLLTHFLSVTAAQRAERLRTRDEYREVLSALISALIEYDGAQVTRARHREGPESESRQAARLDSYRLKALASQQLARVQLVVGEPALVRAAQSAFDATDDINDSRGYRDALARREEAKAALQQLIQVAREMTGA